MDPPPAVDPAAILERLASGELECDVQSAALLQVNTYAAYMTTYQPADAALAAEIGQSLLVANEKLQAEFDALQREHRESVISRESSSVPIDHQHVLHLERSNAELQRDLDSTTATLQTIQSTHTKHVKNATEEVKQLRGELAAVELQLANAQADVERLTRERSAWSEEQRKWKERNEQESTTLANVVGDLEQRLNHSEQQRDTLQKSLDAHRSSNTDLHKLSLDWAEKAEDYEELKSLCEQQALELCECRESLTEAHEAVQMLTGQLEIYLAKHEQDLPDAGNKTLFSEVEDRRLELESQHSMLKRAHVASVHQQSRMKNHISRLTQLTLNQSAGEKLRRLEATVGQLQSENRELQGQVMALERQLADDEMMTGVLGAGSNGGIADASPADAEVLACLRNRSELLAAETETLRKQLRTANMMRANETERSRQYESALAERESDLDGLRATNAQLRFELEEMRQRASADVREDTEDVENDDKENAICENATDTPVHIEQHRHVSPLKERVEDISDASAPVVEGDGNGDDEETHERDTDDWNTVVPAPPTPLRRSPLRQMSDNHDFIDDDDMVPAEFNAIKRHHNNYDAAPPVGPKVVHVRRENVNECQQQ